MSELLCQFGSMTGVLSINECRLPLLVVEDLIDQFRQLALDLLQSFGTGDRIDDKCYMLHVGLFTIGVYVLPQMGVSVKFMQR